MTRPVDLVVVGAGIAGASTAFFAARAGLRVVVIDRGLPAGGATGRTAGYIRCHYANLPEAHFAVESWRTPDGHALAGPVPGVTGLYVLTGGNGKGFKFGPSMGRALAEVVRGADFTASPLAAFAVDRYERGEVIRGEHEYEWGSFA
jgi:glycine/D-amino acid oxidase-like deaminating enzyme